jgi:sec-independent protein translocase protein TatA
MVFDRLGAAAYNRNTTCDYSAFGGLNLGGGKMKLGVPELLIIFGIALLIFGAGKLPQLGKGLGEGIRNFKQSVKEGESGSSSDKKDS